MFFKKIIIENSIVEKLKSFRQFQEFFKQIFFLISQIQLFEFRKSQTS